MIKSREKQAANKMDLFYEITSDSIQKDVIKHSDL